ncbi:MAG: hypothetical protein Q7T99_16390 [Pseudomonas sp.]|nr:hypothetical protein [Pseudomonas sp.]
MADYTELKRLAEAAQYENCEFQHELVAATKAFFVGCIPEQILALIAESARLQSAAKTLERLGYRDNGGELWKPPLGQKPDFSLMDQLKAENEALRESNDKLARRNGMLEQNVEVMTETHILYTWLRKKCDQPSSDVVAVHMNIGHDWATVHDLDTDLRAMIEREEP